MKTRHALALLPVITCGVLACGRSSTEAKELRESSSQTLTDLRAYAADRRDALLEEVDRRLQEADAKLAELSKQGDRAADGATAKAKELRRAVAERLTELQESSADGWSAARDRLASALDDLEQALRPPR